MAPITSRVGSILRICPRQRLQSLSAPAIAAQRRGRADIVQNVAGEHDETPKWDSPFRDEDSKPTTRVPDWGKYMSKRPEATNKVFSYFMVGSMGLLTAAAAKATVQGASRELLSANLWSVVVENEWWWS